MNSITQVTKKFLILLATVSSVAALGACSQPSATNTTPEQPATEQATGTPESTTATTTTAASPTPGSETTATTASPTPGSENTATTATTTPAVASENTDTGVTLASNESETVLEIASSNPSFSTFTKAVEAAGLTETLAGAGNDTVFAPTDEAFAA